jgi:hypothetical protein
MEYSPKLPVPVKCLFCGQDSIIYKNKYEEMPATKTHYTCARCGSVRLTEEAYTDFDGARFSNEDKSILRIVSRNEHEMRGKIPSKKCLMLEDLKRIVDQYKPLDPLAKMDNALANIARASKYVGEKITVCPPNDFPYYHCSNYEELASILVLLQQSDFINFEQANNRLSRYDLNITVKGYQRLREIAKPDTDSKQCFVAIWFTSEMDNVYRKVIKPAIEFKEEGELLPRFKAVKIDNVEHINDINDEIIAQIRRSRFMVCDLTGYRGGIYFEAGFAHGLGLDVIYTCRKDWCKEQPLTDKDGKEINILYDGNKCEIPIKKEGVHFDLAHRNRIEWLPDKLDDFRKKLEDRIKATII